MLFRHGLNAKQVQMWLGHHSPAFTLETYVHLLSNDLPDARFLDALTQSCGIDARPTADQDPVMGHGEPELAERRPCLQT